MYTQSFFHTPVPFCREKERGGCCDFSVNLTLPAWTSERLSNLPTVTNNSVTFPDDFQYNMCSSTSPLRRVCMCFTVATCIWWLSLFCAVTTARPESLVWRKGGVLSLGIRLSLRLMMVEDLGFSIITVLPPNLCWKILAGRSCGSEMSCPDVSLQLWRGCELSRVHRDSLASCALKRSNLAGTTVGGSWCCSVVHPTGTETKLWSSSYWLLKSIIKNLITSENSSVAG